MSNHRLISFDLQSNFAFFKKPDYNDGMLLSYNMLHKPALLGILGAIIGLEGYQKKGELPVYYTRLSSIPVGIEPLEGAHERGNFAKTAVKYTNTVGYANKDGNLLVEETMLIRPAYRCYLLLSMENTDEVKLYQNIANGQAEFIPYLGKNEFQAWWNNVMEYEGAPLIPKTNFKVTSLFIKDGILKGKKVKANFSFSAMTMLNANSYCYFERLPVGFSEQLWQYEMAEFAFTDWVLKPDAEISNLYEVSSNGLTKTIQLF